MNQTSHGPEPIDWKASSAGQELAALFCSAYGPPLFGAPSPILLSCGDDGQGEPDGPDGGDFYTRDYEHWYQEDVLVLTTTADNYKQPLRDHMKETDFYCQSWFIDTDGRPHLLDIVD